jgi:hypothetical protein
MFAVTSITTSWFNICVYHVAKETRFTIASEYKGLIMLRTQVLLTKITQLCNEIRDIDKTIKTNNIVLRLPESTINTNCNKDSADGRGTDDLHEKD